jgi:hypothetical protein
VEQFVRLRSLVEERAEQKKPPPELSSLADAWC